MVEELRGEFDAVFLGMGLAGVNGLGLSGGNGLVRDAVDFIAELRQTAGRQIRFPLAAAA